MKEKEIIRRCIISEEGIFSYIDINLFITGMQKDYDRSFPLSMNNDILISMDTIDLQCLFISIQRVIKNSLLNYLYKNHICPKKYSYLKNRKGILININSIYSLIPWGGSLILSIKLYGDRLLELLYYSFNEFSKNEIALNEYCRAYGLLCHKHDDFISMMYNHIAVGKEIELDISKMKSKF